MFRRLAVLALALCALAALEGCGGTSRLMGPEATEKAPVLGRNIPAGGGARTFGGVRDGDPGGDPGADPQGGVFVDQGDTLSYSPDTEW